MTMTVAAKPLRLHTYFRSTASWRVRIALGLKGVAAELVPHHLRLGQHREADYLCINPQGLVPALEFPDGAVLIQSLAICEWLEETRPEPPLLPMDPILRARIRGFAQVIASDTHPVQNLKVLARLRGLGLGEDIVTAWARDVIADGLEVCQALLPTGQAGPFLFGARPTLAEVCLTPQLGNARRFGVDLGPFDRLLAAEDACSRIEAFAAAVPDRQPDAE